MPGTPQVKTAVQELAASFDQLVYMVKTSAPHLQMYTNDLREKIKTALDQASIPRPAAVAKSPSVPVSGNPFFRPSK